MVMNIIDNIKNVVEYSELSSKTRNDDWLKIIDFLTSKGMDKRKLNIAEISCDDFITNSPYAFDESNNKETITKSPSHSSMEGGTLVFCLWASSMFANYNWYYKYDEKLQNHNNNPMFLYKQYEEYININPYSKIDDILTDDCNINVLLINGIGTTPIDRYLDYKYSVLQRIIPMLGDDCIIILNEIDSKNNPQAVHSTELLTQSGYSLVKLNNYGIFYNATT